MRAYTDFANTSSRRRLTRSQQERVKQGEANDGLQCLKCLELIPCVGGHVEVLPCRCEICPECLLELIGEQGTKNVVCPAISCDSLLCGHQFFNNRLANRSKVQYNKSSNNYHENQLLYTPFVALMAKYKDFMASCTEKLHMTMLWSVRVTLTAAKKIEGMTKCVGALIQRGIEPPDETYCNNFQKFMAFLSPSVMPQSKTTVTTLTAPQFLHHKVDHKTPLLAGLFGLATGNTTIRTDMVKRPITGGDQSSGAKSFARKIQSQFFAIAGATDMLLRSVS